MRSILSLSFAASAILKLSEIRILSLTLLLVLNSVIAVAADNKCTASGEYEFVCGPQNAEDLVLVAETKWIISSGMARGAVMYLIDSQEKTWSNLYPTDSARSRQDMETYGACPGSPDPDNFVTHGLNIRAGVNGHSTLFVVGHGGREAIEVFDVDANNEQPVLTWTGCVTLPEGMAANSVASFGDGSLVVTVPLHPGYTIGDSMAGKLTGAVYAWSPGDGGFTIMQGTELPYGNGIEVSDDGEEIYVVSSGLFSVVTFSNSNPSRQLRTTETLAFVPDNIHWGSDGMLITAGMVLDYPDCGSVGGAVEFDLAEFATCPRPFIASAIDPRSMESKELIRSPANERFSNATMALPVGEDIWIGTFSGDRIGYLSLK